MKSQEIHVTYGGRWSEERAVPGEAARSNRTRDLQLMTVDQGAWGGDSSLIEEWFAAGEALADLPREVPEPELQETSRALNWMRSLAAATGLRSS